METKAPSIEGLVLAVVARFNGRYRCGVVAAVEVKIRVNRPPGQKHSRRTAKKKLGIYGVHKKLHR